jgi:hypothetical protein
VNSISGCFPLCRACHLESTRSAAQMPREARLWSAGTRNQCTWGSTERGRREKAAGKPPLGRPTMMFMVGVWRESAQRVHGRRCGSVG